MSTDAASHARGKTYVLVHGAWHGAWCWRAVADMLRGMGHGVTTPTQTGVGERRHLLSADITLDTFVADIVNHIEAEELTDIILVGHSFGGTSITGVADTMPERIRHLVYLDAVIVEGGKPVFSIFEPDLVAARRRQVQDEGRGIFLPPPPVTAFGIPADHPSAAWVRRRLTPHPVGTYESPLKLDHPIGNGRPCTYVACTSPIYAPLERPRQWARQQADWIWQELPTGHNAMILAPAELARLLDAIG